MADLTALRREVCALHLELPRNNLVAWTSGNLSARIDGEDLMLIKPSDVAYAELTPAGLTLRHRGAVSRRWRCLPCPIPARRVVTVRRGDAGAGR